MNTINLDKSPSFHIKRARDVFEHMMVNDFRVRPLKWVGLNSAEDYVEYTFYSDLSFYIDPPLLVIIIITILNQSWNI